jgi:predicted RND superfamily exporter protein
MVSTLTRTGLSALNQTSGGMWSFSFSDVAPVAGLGIFASASIVLGLLFVLIFLPLERTDFTCEYKHTIYNKINICQLVYLAFLYLYNIFH